MFETNLHLSQFIKLAEEKTEIKLKEEIVCDREFIIACYVVVKNDTFNTPLAREVRGLVFDKKTGLCISRPFHKFFNIDENDFAKRENIDWKNSCVSNKWDGSMAIPVVINNKICWKTKRSFYSDVALKIQKFWNYEIMPEKRRKFTNIILEAHKNNETVIFEFISPTNRIVVQYNFPDLCYLATRNNITGKYSKIYGVTTFRQKSIDEFINLIRKMKSIEGFVIYDGNDLYKIKTDWYFERHKVISGLSAKFIVNATLDEKIDDVLGFIRQIGMDSLADEVEKERDRVVKEYLFRYNFSYKCFEDLKHIKDRKTFAEKVLSTKYKPLSPYLFRLFDGKPFDNLLKRAIRRDMVKVVRNLGIGG